jgi:hypothetical protein
MAITTFHYSAGGESSGSAPFYNKEDLIDQLQSALSWAGIHGAAISGLVKNIDSYTGGGTAASFGSTTFQDCFAETEGSGSGASFMVARSGGGSITNVFVNRPGSGYAENEALTISAADIGGSDNDATDITFNANVIGGATPSTFGSASTWFDKDTNGTYPWGVARRVIENNKRFGDTYTGFKATSETQIKIYDGSSFHPTNTDDTADKKHGYANSWRGSAFLDGGTQSGSYSGGYGTKITDSSSDVGGHAQQLTNITVSGGTDKPLQLNIFKSGLDTNFVVFNYTQHTRSSTKISDNNYATFFLHNFTSSLWDYDHLYLGGLTLIEPGGSGDSTSCTIDFQTFMGPRAAKRSALWGYSNFNSVGDFLTRYKGAFADTGSSYYDNFFYVRTANTSRGGDGGTKDGGSNSGSTGRSSLGYGVDALDSNVHYNAVIKGIPLNAKIAPSPYYIPDDFVLINFEFHTTQTNIQQGDTITVSDTEVYVIICASYNYEDSKGFTRGIAFCGRKI